MKKLKRFLSISLVLVFSIVLCACGTKEEGKKEVEGKKEEGFSIVDSYDRTVEFDKAPEKIAVLNSDIYQMICLLGGRDKIVGISDTVKFPEPPTSAEIIGGWDNINVEKILEVAPDAVFAYGKYTDEEAKNKLESAGIKVLFIDSYKFNQMEEEVLKVGKILGNEDTAKEFNSFVKKYSDIISERIGSLSDEEKAKVYFEGYSDYKTVGKSSAGQELLNVAGVKNIAENEEGDYPKISDEWIIEKNPDVVIKIVSGSNGILGDKITDTTKVKEVYSNLLGRTGWDTLDSVKNKNVYILDNSTTLSAQGLIVGALEIAKICYPDKFEDINPEEIHKELYEKFYNMDLEGMFLYGGDK